METCDLGTDCLCTAAMRGRCEFRGAAMPAALRPADRFVIAVVVLCACTGFLAGALFMAVL